MRSSRWLALACVLVAGGPQRLASQAEGFRWLAPSDWSDATVRGEDIRTAQRLSGELMSPFCPGYTLERCPSPSADSLRRWIRAELAQGRPEDSVVARLVAVYGEQVLSAPPASGRGRWLWFVPAAGLPLAAGIVLLLVRRFVRRAPVSRPASPSAPPADPALEARLHLQLRHLDA